MKYIEEAWRDYVARVLPPTAGPVQIRETRRAFYAGATVLFSTILRLEPDGDCTKKDLELMESLSAEIDEFCADLEREGQNVTPS